MAKIIIRSDDFDFRLEPEQYKAIHEEFIKRDLVETAVLQYAHFGRLGNFNPETIKYLNEASNWDIQLHGWDHEKYSEMDYTAIYRDIAAAKYMSMTLFGKYPTVWYPPWNCYSDTMKQVADELGLVIDNESYDMGKFIRELEAGTYTGHSVYFHGWQKVDVDRLPTVLDYCKLQL